MKCTGAYTLVWLLCLASQVEGQTAEAATPTAIVGWRGDGSGRFPDAKSPIHWDVTAKSLQRLRAQASRPKDDDTGQPIPDGVIRQWLVLGPVTWDEDTQP